MQIVLVQGKLTNCLDKPRPHGHCFGGGWGCRKLCLIKRWYWLKSIFFLSNIVKIVQLEDKNVIKLILITLRDRMKKGRVFSNAKKDPMTSKDLKEIFVSIKKIKAIDMLSPNTLMSVLMCIICIISFFFFETVQRWNF